MKFQNSVKKGKILCMKKENQETYFVQILMHNKTDWKINDPYYTVHTTRCDKKILTGSQVIVLCLGYNVTLTNWWLIYKQVTVAKQ